MMSQRTTSSQIRDFPAGTSVGYGRAYETAAPRRLAVVGIGYADGLSRLFSGRIQFLLHGKKVPVVGNICMDMCMVDVSDVPEAKVGDVATVFGGSGRAEISVNDVAEQLGTISYDILCGINKRIPRIYLDGKRQAEILQYIV